MGDQISCDIGPDYVEIVIIYPPFQYINQVLSSEAPDHTQEVHFLSLLKNDIAQLKSHPLYLKLEKNPTPVLVSGITYDSFFDRLSELFNHPIERSEKCNYTVISISHYWKYNRRNFYEYQLTSVPPDGSISVSNDLYSKIPLEITNLYPYLLVNVKSGVSIYEVQSEKSFRKIGGSCLGINTIWALLKGDGSVSFEELVQQAEFGDNSQVDMTVGDIYGARYLNLPEKLTASSCGKLKDLDHFEQKDLSASLLFMLLFNLGQIAAMHCFELGLEKMVVVGSVFINDYVSRLMRFTLNYYSNGGIRMIFCENSRYLRCLGVFMNRFRLERFNTC